MTEQLKPRPFCGGIAKAYERTCDKSDRYDPSHRAFPIVRCGSCGCCAVGKDWTEPDTAVKQWNRRAQPAQAGAEPVAFVHWPLSGPPRLVWYSNKALDAAILKTYEGHQPDMLLYTHPPARVPLTDEEILHRVDTHVGGVNPGNLDNSDWINFAHAVIATYESKNGIGGGK